MIDVQAYAAMNATTPSHRSSVHVVKWAGRMCSSTFIIVGYVIPMCIRHGMNGVVHSSPWCQDMKSSARSRR